MTTIKQALERIIRDNDFLEDGLHHGYINLTSLATYLLPSVQKLTRKKTTIASLTMTMSRIARDIQSPMPRYHFSPDTARVRKGISFVNFQKSPGLQPALNSIDRELVTDENSTGQLYSQLEGSREVTVLYTDFFKPAIDRICQNFVPKVHITDLVSVALRLPNDSLQEHGIIYRVVKQLAFFDINIIELYTTQNELTFVIHPEDLSKAMQILT